MPSALNWRRWIRLQANRKPQSTGSCHQCCHQAVWRRACLLILSWKTQCASLPVRLGRRWGSENRDVRRHEIPAIRNNIEAVSDRFLDRTIPQAVTLLLREEGGPLHVNEIYNRLLEGGFKFTGANPTISVAVSLNRNTRFRKVSPGTFDLMIRDASKAS